MPVHEPGTGPPGRRVPSAVTIRVTLRKQVARQARRMDTLSIDTVPLFVVPGPESRAFVVHLDERRGTVHVDPADA